MQQSNASSPESTALELTPKQKGLANEISVVMILGKAHQVPLEVIAEGVVVYLARVRAANAASYRQGAGREYHNHYMRRWMKAKRARLKTEKESKTATS